LRHQRIRDLLAVAATAALVVAPFGGVSAQRSSANPPPRVMVPTFLSSDPALGQQAADALRSRISHDINGQTLVVISKQDIENTLKASGYSTTEALQLGDARALAVLLRADEFIDGNVTKTPTGVKIESRLVLA
jgi:hypothetical protein